MSASCAGRKHGFGQVTKYLQNWKTGPIVGWAVLINKDEWAKVPADLQKLIQDEMLALQEEGFHTYNEYQATVQKLLEEEGAEFWVASDSELERLFVPKYTDAVYETWYKRAEELGYRRQGACPARAHGPGQVASGGAELRLRDRAPAPGPSPSIGSTPSRSNNRVS